MQARLQVGKALAAALRDPESLTHLSASDLDLMIRCSRQVRLHGRLGALLDDAGLLDRLDPSARDLLISARNMAKARERVALWELDRLAWAVASDFAKPLVCTKGAAYILLQVPNVAGRIFADVDLIVEEQSIASAENLLNERGWKTKRLTPYDDNYYRKWTHELPPLTHVERDVEVDLHHNILPRTARLKPDADVMLGDIESIEDSPFFVLSDVDLVLHAAVHLMFDSELADKLRDLLDFEILVQHFSAQDDSFWHRLADRAETQGLERPLYYCVRYTTMLLNGDYPQDFEGRCEMHAPAKPIQWLMDVMVPRALLPSHPDISDRLNGLSRLILYIRSHWLRMPPWLLAYHLGYKFYRMRIRPRLPWTGDAPTFEV